MSETVSDTDRAKATVFMAQVANLPIPQIVPNNAVTLTTPSEIQACLIFGMRPITLLVMNPSVAKTLALSLLDRVRDYEQMVGHEVQPLDVLRSRHAEA